MSIIHKQTDPILNSLKEIFMILGENPEMVYEFVYCDDILLMADYIFSNDELIKKHTKFITEIIITFCNLLNYKLECISSKKDYDKKLYEFRFYIANKRTTFYTQIDNCNIDSEASEVIDFMIKVLE